VFFFEDEGLRCTNYLTGITVASTPVLVAVLNFFDRWRKSKEIKLLLGSYSASSVRSTLRQLMGHTLLIEKGSAQANREEGMAAWNAWEVEARFFHFATKHAFRLGAPLPDETKLTRTLLRKGPQPELVKGYSSTGHTALPSPVPSLNSEFPRVLLGRRTFREFGRGRLSRAPFRLAMADMGCHWAAAVARLRETNTEDEPFRGRSPPDRGLLLGVTGHGLAKRRLSLPRGSALFGTAAKRCTIRSRGGTVRPSGMGARLRRAFRDDGGVPPGDVALRLLSRISHGFVGSGTFLPDVLPGRHVVRTGSVLYRSARRQGNRGGPAAGRFQRVGALRCRRRSETPSSIGGLRSSGGE